MAPKWVVYALAGTYWRIFGNPQNGINCFKWALESVPSNYEDVVLTNLAGLLYKSGALDDALQGYNLKLHQSIQKTSWSIAKSIRKRRSVLKMGGGC